MHSRRGNVLKSIPPTSGAKRSRMQLVPRDPSLDQIPDPDGKATGLVWPERHYELLLDPVWSKDIRDYYNAVVWEPMPQEILDLLAKIAPDISG
jgi:hypothetical protein